MSGRIIIISGPSRCGKNTALASLLADKRFRFRHVTTYTTRPKRDNEQEGVHHFFVTPKKFREKIRHGEFLEWARVRGAYFGTPLNAVITALENNESILLEIDIQGTQLIKQKLSNSVTTIFLKPSSILDVQKRLRLSGFSAAQQRIRMAEARREIAVSNRYDHVVESRPGKLHQAIREITAIVRAALRSSPTPTAAD